MAWTHWLVTQKYGMDWFTPYELHDDGSFSVVLGMVIGTTLDELKKNHPVKKVVRVDDEYELTNPRIEWEVA